MHAYVKTERTNIEKFFCVLPLPTSSNSGSQCVCVCLCCMLIQILEDIFTVLFLFFTQSSLLKYCTFFPLNI